MITEGLTVESLEEHAKAIKIEKALAELSRIREIFSNSNIKFKDNEFIISFHRQDNSSAGKFESYIEATKELSNIKIPKENMNDIVYCILSAYEKATSDRLAITKKAIVEEIIK